MPPARPTSRRNVTNENDENAATTRLTRAKAAALTSSHEASAADPPKKAVTKKTTTGATTTRKRNALGDVTNAKGEVADAKGGKDGKEAKKPLTAKRGAVAQAAAPTGVTKASKTTTTRSVLGPKEKATVKRPASGSGAVGGTTKKRVTTTKETKETIKEEEVPASENIAPTKQTTKSKVEAKVVEPVVEAPPKAALKAAPSKPEPAPAKAAPEVKEAFVEKYDDVPEIPDLDEEDANDPLMVSEYVCEIFEYLKELEIATMANPDYMDNQSELEWKMRGILVDWLLEVHTRFRLLPETLFLAVNIIDRFLSRKVVQLDRLQLVGVTAMFIASKYEEVLSPHVQNFRHVADDGFTEEEILSAERFVLAALDYDLSYPNPMNFLRRISKADNYDIQTRTLGKYLLEISCLDHRFIAYPPSQISAAAMYLARLVLDRGEWDAVLAHYAGYTEEEIKPVLDLMIDYLKAPVIHEAFFKKYASKKFLKASIVLRQWAKKYCVEPTSSSKEAKKPTKSL
ncbi:Cyclin [Lasiodiplodia theobromae]|uniref:G2/mitotic-specific cyclin-B n=1 Tax=Lasiodiplodia theobromae TaxID=45133 RepID=A0A5N5DEB9_9PEZI|nr:Cyclin [Lasiodiplodia theobromae]KAB2576055.1 G2/mitotic-specific cyclin-B [Lasiodiplodia theobromae]KAF4534383.1 Cyclin [Lasiodiplodia theobromae]KAF9640055.1 Cyclin [Lasiodiplodia theobromae]